MSQVWSEINKVVNVLDPASSGTGHASTASGVTTSDIVNLKNYKKCTFVIHTGASAANTPVVTILAGENNTTSDTAIAYKYRTQIVGKGGYLGATGSDVPSALEDATATGFAMTTETSGGVYIIEVDAPTVCAGTTAGAATDYDHVKMVLTNGSTAAAQFYGVIAILSEPRYPQAILQTAID